MSSFTLPSFPYPTLPYLPTLSSVLLPSVRTISRSPCVSPSLSLFPLSHLFLLSFPHSLLRFLLISSFPYNPILPFSLPLPIFLPFFTPSLSTLHLQSSIYSLIFFSFPVYPSILSLFLFLHSSLPTLLISSFFIFLLSTEFIE